MATERGAPWGLARISHRNSLTLSTFQKYEYVEEGGEGVDAYVIDTGEQFPSVYRRRTTAAIFFELTEGGLVCFTQKVSTSST
jgi:hypothetical protein